MATRQCARHGQLPMPVSRERYMARARGIFYLSPKISIDSGEFVSYFLIRLPLTLKVEELINEHFVFMQVIALGLANSQPRLSMAPWMEITLAPSTLSHACHLSV